MSKLYVILADDSYAPNRTLEFSAYNTDMSHKNDLSGYGLVSKGGNASFIQAFISGISQGSPGIVTAAGCHTAFTKDDEVVLASVGGMTQVDGWARVGTVTTDHFELHNLDGTPMDTRGFTAYTSGGTVDLIRRRTAHALVHSGDARYTITLGRPGDRGAWDTGECDMLGRGKVYVRAAGMLDVEVDFQIVEYDPNAAGDTKEAIAAETVLELMAALLAGYTSAGTVGAALNKLIAPGADPMGLPGPTGDWAAKIDALYARAFNKVTTTNSANTLRNHSDTATIATEPLSDDGVTFVKGQAASRRIR